MTDDARFARLERRVRILAVALAAVSLAAVAAIVVALRPASELRAGPLVIDDNGVRFRDDAKVVKLSSQGLAIGDDHGIAMLDSRQIMINSLTGEPGIYLRSGSTGFAVLTATARTANLQLETRLDGGFTQASLHSGSDYSGITASDGSGDDSTWKAEPPPALLRAAPPPPAQPPPSQAAKTSSNDLMIPF